jgi:anti-sigma factor RsiW
MNRMEQDNTDDRRLWEQFRAALRAEVDAAGACPGMLDLAAYVDGRLDESHCDAVEAHLAACPACLQTVIETRELLAGGAMLCPPDVTKRAKAIRPKRRTTAVLRWAASAAAAVLFALGGYLAGSATGTLDPDSETKLIREMSFGTIGETQDDLLLVALADPGGAE